MAEKRNYFDLDLAQMQAFFAELDEKPFRAVQLIKWVYQQGVIDLDTMSNLSKVLRQKLKDLGEFRLPEVVLDRVDHDGTRKWLLRLDDGNCIEMVYIPEADRGTLCVSSQVGCVLNCSFCSTARQGFNRNLSTAEIIAQLWIAVQSVGQFATTHRKITNVVLMGMGEPLLNYDNVITALHLMMDDNAFGMSKRRVTLSTAGVVPMIDQLAGEIDVALAVSLHATRDNIRDELVPINKKYPIKQLLESCKRFTDAKQQRMRITFEYVMLDGINDRPEHAHELLKLLKNIPAKMNLIPFNPFPGSQYRRSSEAAILRFQKILIDNGLTTMVRRTRGDNIDAACGQLAGQVQDRTRRQQKLGLQQAGGAR